MSQTTQSAALSKVTITFGSAPWSLYLGGGAPLARDLDVACWLGYRPDRIKWLIGAYKPELLAGAGSSQCYRGLSSRGDGQRVCAVPRAHRTHSALHRDNPSTPAHGGALMLIVEYTEPHKRGQVPITVQQECRDAEEQSRFARAFRQRGMRNVRAIEIQEAAHGQDQSL